MKNNTITKLLGVTQTEVARLLGVHRSQWSMYESGKRDLPLHAKQLLAEMLTYVQSADSNAMRRHATRQEEQKQQQLERLLRENEYQLLLLEKKLAAAKRKQEAEARLLLLSDFLAQRSPGKGRKAESFAKLPIKKQSIALEPRMVTSVINMEIKKETLELENLVLKGKLMKFPARS